MTRKDTRGNDGLGPVAPAHKVGGMATRAAWARIGEACGDLVPARFPYGHRWMAWACWIRAEEQDPQALQCGSGCRVCFDDEAGAVEHWRAQRDQLCADGIDPKAGFAPPDKDGNCPSERAQDDAALGELFGASIRGSSGPIAPPGTDAIRHIDGCARGRCAADGESEQGHRWYLRPKLHRPVAGARRTTVTIDWRWSDEQILGAIKRLRSIVRVRPEQRDGGAPFWNRYGAGRTVELYDLRAAGQSVRAWAKAEAKRREVDVQDEQRVAFRVLGKMEAAVDDAARGRLRRVLGW